jgi:molybdenum cofactor biosynthesis protein B
MPIDESLTFKPVRIALLTISDSRSAAEDRSGDKLEELLTGAGHILAARAIIRDETDLIVSRLHNWIDDTQVDVVITTGGTGLTGRDVTPEALHRLAGKDDSRLRRAVPLPELRRRSAPRRSSRAPPPCVARGTYIFALPGSTGAVTRRVGRHPRPPSSTAATSPATSSS